MSRTEPPVPRLPNDDENELALPSALSPDLEGRARIP